MGLGLAANLSANGLSVAGWDKESDTSEAIAADSEAAGLTRCRSLEDLIGVIGAPRTILLSIPSGRPVDQVIEQLLPALSPGDVIIDTGNSHFRDTARRAEDLEKTGVKYLGVGVSGGPDGARHGPALMVGGDEGSWRRLQPMFDAIAAKVDGTPCCGYFGPGGAGHFVKMVHNGIEYAVMHLLMETCAILTSSHDMDGENLGKAITALNSGLTKCFLTEVTGRVLVQRVPGDDALLSEVVTGTVGQKGTGQWSVVTALEQGVAVPTIAEAVMYRALSGEFDSAALVSLPSDFDTDRIPDPLSTLSDALSLGFISAFLQGLAIIDSCEESLGDSLDRTEVLRTWRGGCILQGELVEFLWRSAESNKTDDILNTAPVQAVIERTRTALRHAVAACSLDGVPCPGLSSSLAYIESRTAAPLPTAILQLQRDYFGQHGLRDKRDGRSIDVSWNREPGQT